MPGCFVLDTHKNPGLAIVAFDHGHRSGHILLEPIDVGAVLKPQGRLGVPQFVDATLVVVCVSLAPWPS